MRDRLRLEKRLANPQTTAGTITANYGPHEKGHYFSRKGRNFDDGGTDEQKGDRVRSSIKYDLVGKTAADAQLLRATTTAILTGVKPKTFAQFKDNPEQFILKTTNIINEQKATMVIERLEYDPIADKYEVDIFTANQEAQDLTGAFKGKHHVYDYVVLDSNVERRFVEKLDVGKCVVYAKLPRSFLILTPVGNYNPDWAISFKKGDVKHVYFVAETKGSMATMSLRQIEDIKIKCARKFFCQISQVAKSEGVKYGMVSDYGELMDLVT